MRNYAVNIFALCCAGMLFMSSGCETDVPTPGPMPQPFTCLPGFTKAPDEDRCDCISPSVEIGGQECRELLEDEYYSSMADCPLDIGMIIKIGDTVRIGDRGTIFIRMFIEDPTSDRTTVLYSENTLKLYPGENLRDSVAFEVSFQEYRFKLNPNDNYVVTWFRGVIEDENTITGRFDFGFANDFDNVQASCPATFRKRVQ